MKVREYIKVIGENKIPEDMEKLGDLLAELVCSLKESHPDIYEEYKMKLYEIAYGKKLTKEYAEKWVEGMEPEAKWNFDTTTRVKRQYGLEDISDVDFYVVMNMMYSDMHNVLGTGDTEESLRKYIQATKDWLYDPDATENKLYNYWRYVVR